MRELVATTYCDICLGVHDKRTHADEDNAIRVIVNGKPKRLDVCHNHANPRWSEIQDHWLDDLNGNQPMPRAVRKKILCELCGENVAETRHGLLMHMTRKHADVALAERQRIAGFPQTSKNVRPRK